MNKIQSKNHYIQFLEIFLLDFFDHKRNALEMELEVMLTQCVITCKIVNK